MDVPEKVKMECIADCGFTEENNGNWIEQKEAKIAKAIEISVPANRSGDTSKP
jgi:hypothetical protein